MEGILLNSNPIDIEAYGDAFKVFLVANKYETGSYAIYAYTQMQEMIAFIALDVVEYRKDGVIKENEVILNEHLIKDLSTGMKPILQFLTDGIGRYIKPESEIVAIELRPEILSLLK